MTTEQEPEQTTTSPFSVDSSGSRHLSRELALQVLFQWDFHGHQNVGITEFWKERPVSPEVKAFALSLIQGVQKQCAELDLVIQRHAKHWTIDRMQLVDRNILRQSLYELIWMDDIPARVTLNEALQLAKSFADDEARRFINGILDQVLRADPRLEAKRRAVSEEKISGPPAN